MLVPSIVAAAALPSQVWTARAAPTTNATVNEYPIPTAGSAPTSIASAPGGSLWFTENSGNKIGTITTSGVMTEYPLPTAGSAPQTITAGPDGAMWFTETAGDKIGRIDTSGTITEFPVTAAASGPWGITSGPDGKLWFTEQNSGNVASMTTGGVVSEYSTGGCALGNITAGADGNLWFLDLCGQIGTVTTTGVVTMSGYSGGLCCATDITHGPDGNLWVSSGDHNSGLGVAERVTTSMSVTRFPTPTASTTTPQGIAAGPNGAMFMTDSGDQIVESSVAGAMTDFPLPTAGVGATSITAGSDSRMWFVENSGNAIGALTIPASCADYEAGVDHPSVGPGMPVTISLTLLNCGASATISGATTSSSTTAPSGCPAAPPIHELSATVAPGQSSTKATPIAAPQCTGTYSVSSTASDGSPLGSSSTSYSVAIGGSIGYTNPGAAAGGRPAFITAGPDGNLWFTESGGPNDLVRMTPSGATTQFSSPSGHPQAVTWGPDGNLWMADAFGSSISSMTTSGATVKQVPAAHEFIWNLTTGPDGNIWYIARDFNGGEDVGRVTPAGQLTVFPVVPTTTFNPLTITGGPDGNVWFGAGDNVGRITPKGAVTLFPVGAGGFVRSIVTGHDGNLWFTYPQNNVGRVTPAGVISLFPTPTASSLPAMITPGADGNAWFTEIGGVPHQSQLGRVTPGGSITEFPIANLNADNAQYGLTSGPDGNVWAAAYYGFVIGQIGIGPPASCTPVSASPASTTLAQGSKQTITATITNCGTAPHLVKVVAKTTATCGPSFTSHTFVTLLPRTGTTTSSTTPVLHCKGTYTAKITISSGGSTLGSATTTYTVS